MQYISLAPIALALADKDNRFLFTVPDTTEAEDETAYLNFSRIIKSYISPFAKVEPATALQYTYLVALGSDAPDGSGERQKTACLELIRDIVLASRAWSKLLGSVRADSTKEVS